MNGIECNYDITTSQKDGKTVYGITLTEYSASGIASESYPEISCDFETVSDFAKLLEHGEVTLATFCDCVEDFVAQL